MEKIEHIGWKSESTPVQIGKWGVMIENKINEIIDRLNEQPDIQAYIDFIEQLIKTREDRAREEGRREGVEQMGYWVRDNIKTVEQEDIDEAEKKILQFLSKLTTK